MLALESVVSKQTLLKC